MKYWLITAAGFLLLLLPVAASAQTTYTSSAVENNSATLADSFGVGLATYSTTVESNQKGPVIIDLEAYNAPGAVYSSQGTLEFQTSTAVNLTDGIPMTCTWTAPVIITANEQLFPGAPSVFPPFVLKVGLFTTNWSSLLDWNNAAGTFSNVKVGASATDGLSLAAEIAAGQYPKTTLIGCNAADGNSSIATSTAMTIATTTLPSTSNGSIDQNGKTVRAGTSIDFVGHNFGREEQVVVSLNGITVTTAHADGGGNFSTGSLPTPTTAGAYTYTFTGQTSGITGSANITLAAQ